MIDPATPAEHRAVAELLVREAMDHYERAGATSTYEARLLELASGQLAANVAQVCAQLGTTTWPPEPES
jgi:hypothetical protein